MKDNKNIERLFQEKFKDFEALPPQDSWNLIASRLNEKKKKKRIVPVWFQISGIAASLFLIAGLIWNFSDENQIEIPDSNSTIVNTKDAKKDATDSKFNTPNNTEIITDSQSNKNTTEKPIDNLVHQNNDGINSSFNHNSKNNVVSNNTVKDNVKSSLIHTASSNEKGESLHMQNNTINMLVNSEKNKDNNGLNPKLNKNNNGFENLVENNFVDKNNSDSNTAIDKEKQDVSFFNKTSNTIVNNGINFTKSKVISPTATLNEILSKDSTLIVEIPKELNPLEELLKEKEAGKNEDEKEEKRSKWAISTNASPVYFNSLAQGSSIDEQFDSNSKNYATTLSFGIAGSYTINNKLSLKTGINNINLSYNTNDVVFDARLRAVESNIPSISRNADATNMIFTSKNNTTEAFLGDVENVILENNVGALQQNIGYIEVPLELSYKVLDKKFGVEVIGGMSTLFLNQNNISLVANGIEMEVGKANNLNSIHFSSNVGLGFKYSFWKSFNANFQPMFKYQINTFSENSGNFKPYFIGLYTGISFSF